MACHDYTKSFPEPQSVAADQGQDYTDQGESDFDCKKSRAKSQRRTRKATTTARKSVISAARLCGLAFRLWILARF
jgi:hypothetical protein